MINIPKGCTHVFLADPLGYNQSPMFMKWGYDFTGPESGVKYFHWFIWHEQNWTKDTSFHRVTNPERFLKVNDFMRLPDQSSTINVQSQVLTPSDTLNFADPAKPSLFLAGTIEMGNSEDWQKIAVQKFMDLPINIFNPRRIVAPDEDRIADQINWELDSIDKCQFIFMHLCANTISPISLYELGLLQGNRHHDKSIVVVCDPQYTRKTNVLVTLRHPVFGSSDISITQNFGEGVAMMRERIKSFS